MDNFVYAKGQPISGIALILSIAIVIQTMPWHLYDLGMKIFGGIFSVGVIWIGLMIVFEVVCLCLATFIRFLLRAGKDS